MKELSIEEKLVTMMRLLKEQRTLLKMVMKEKRTIAESIFARIIEESEDERIRRALISILKSDFEKDTTIYDISVGDIIAWLEKQGEQKPVIEGTLVNIDEVREDFMQEVYRILNADPTNDRANQIIDAFDHLPTNIIRYGSK